MAAPVLPKVQVSTNTAKRDQEVIDHQKKQAELAAIASIHGASVMSQAIDGETHGKKLSEMPSMQLIKETRDELQNYDFELLQKQVSGNLKAALSGSKQEYEAVKNIQNNKQALKKYLGEKDEEDEKVNEDAVSEKYEKDLDKPAYQDFWEDLSKVKNDVAIGKRRNSQAPSRGNVTSRGSGRRGSGMLPDINKRS